MADTHTPATVHRAICARLAAAGLKPGAASTATGNPSPLSDSSYTVTTRACGDTGAMRSRADGHMRVRVDFTVELLHVAPPKGGPQEAEQKRLAEWTSAVRHLLAPSTDLTTEAVCVVGDATFDKPGAGAYLRTTMPVAVEFVMALALSEVTP